MNRLIVLLMLFISFPLFATKYYVDNSGGDDAKNGLTTGTAWKTLAKVNSSTFAPGDSILLIKDGVWRETLIIPSSGTSSNYIYFGSYGSGTNNPRILGSIAASGWTATGTANVWSCNTSMTNPTPYTSYGDVHFWDGSSVHHWGVVKVYSSGFTNLTTEYDWCWYSNVLYVYSPTDPATRYNSVEADQRQYCINLNFQQYISIAYIDMFYGYEAGVSEKNATYNYYGFILHDLTTSYHGYPNGVGYGSEVCYNDMNIYNVTTYENGRRGISVVNYGTANISNISIHHCTMYNGFHTTSVDMETGSSGGTYSGNLDNVYIYDNLIYDDSTRTLSSGAWNQLFLQGPHGSTGQIFHTYIYNNKFRNNPGNSVSLENVTGPIYVYNNTFADVGINGLYFVYLDKGYGSGNMTVNLRNNIYSSYSTDNTYGKGAGLVTVGQNTSYLTSDYNLYFRPNNTVRIAIINGTSYYTNQIADLRSALGYETNSPTPANPAFSSTTTLDIGTTSPAKGAGTNVSWNTTDYIGKTWNYPSSIGALEYYPGSVSVPTLSTTAVSGIGTISAISGGTLTNAGGGTITARGICWNTSTNPTISNSKTTDLILGAGIYVDTLTSLERNTLYYVRAYATNSAGTSYGANETFTTLSTAATPTITISTINTYSQLAKVIARITDNGGYTVSEKGICYGTSTNPTTGGAHVVSGTGDSAFLDFVRGLSPNTTYHVRAYATNSQGTGYSADVEITTTTKTILTY